MHEIIFLSFFRFGVKGTSQIQSGKKFTCDINQYKCFTNFLNFKWHRAL